MKTSYAHLYSSRFPTVVLPLMLFAVSPWACGGDSGTDGDASGGAGGSDGSDAGGEGAAAPGAGGAEAGARGTPEAGAGGVSDAGVTAGEAGALGETAGLAGALGASGGASSAEGGAGGASAGRGGGEPGAGGEAGAAEDCGTEDTACELLADQGLCKEGACSPCAEPSDDDACATAYGAQALCLEGVCRTGCRGSEDCEGRVCDAATSNCRRCYEEADCPDSAPYCDLDSGECVSEPPICQNNDECAGGTGWCCDGTCYAGAEDGCCSDDDCGGGTCSPTTHLCVLEGCDAPPEPDRFYVDSDPVGDMYGVGSEDCPFKSLNTALQNIPEELSSTFTVCTRGTFQGKASSWPRMIPSNVVLDGHYCQPNNATPTNLTVPVDLVGVDIALVVSGGVGGQTMHGYAIDCGGTDTPEGAARTGVLAINPTATPISIYDVSVTGCGVGIHMSGGANLLLGGGVDLMSNGRGLSIGDGSTVDINLSADTEVRSRFSQNELGIRVSGGTLTIEGTTYGDDPFERTVIANGNTEYGLVVVDGATAVVDHLLANNNDVAALYVNQSASLTLRNSVLRNGGHGLETSWDAVDLSNIDLGTAPTGDDAGNNYIYGNAGCGIRLQDSDTGILDAQGNVFSEDDSKNCQLPEGDSTPLRHSTACDGDDVSYVNKINVLNCDYE